MEQSCWRGLPRVVRWPLLGLGFMVGIGATWFTMLFGYLQAEPTCTLRRAGLHRGRLAVNATRDAVRTFEITRGRCPSDQEELVADHLLSTRDVRDPWGSKIIYWCEAWGNGRSVTAMSPGPDRVLGTPDDIQSD